MAAAPEGGHRLAAHARHRPRRRAPRRLEIPHLGQPSIQRGAVAGRPEDYGAVQIGEVGASSGKARRATSTTSGHGRARRGAPLGLKEDLRRFWTYRSTTWATLSGDEPNFLGSPSW